MSEGVLLNGVRELLSRIDDSERHPGLALDKFSAPGEQDTQKEAKKVLDRVCKAGGDHGLLKEAAARRDAALAGTGVETWKATTSGPLTLHLSRANALENAGIALHPLYGFAYLPGSGLKGAARAYAETVWLPAQADQEIASRRIVAVFGCAPDSDKDKDWLPETRQKAKDSSAGAVVFHDAWPETWPKLFVDIAAIHHPQYYQASEGQVPPPGDWETPNLVSFLAIPAGTTFRFAVAPRVGGTRADATAVGDAKGWLNGALATLGVGAKTAAGYGLFRTDALAPGPMQNRAVAEFELKLVTPAFLAGGAQGKEDCDLRGASLRGQLRWWWRTMHAAHLEPATLRRLEAAVWGASSDGSAVQFRVTAGATLPAEQFNYNADKNSPFLAGNKIEVTSFALPAIEARKTTQGLYYAAYGAGQERTQGVLKPGRFFRQPASTWHLRIAARASAYRTEAKAKTGVPIEAAEILRQASAALFLLTRYGGVGAKARKGFGSFADILIDGIGSIEDCKEAARNFRALCGLASKPQHDAPSLELMSAPVIMPTTWTNAWFALNRIGEAMQAFAKSGKHQAWKSALGIPRKSDHRSATAGYLVPKVLIPNVKDKTIDRHAAPIHYHVAATSEQKLEIRLVTFVSPHLPDDATSRQRLDELRTYVQKQLAACAQEGGTAKLFPKAQSVVAAPDSGKPLVGGRVWAALTEKTAKGSWRAKDLASETVRSIQNSYMVPADKKVGDSVELEVPNNAEFKWPVSKPAAPPPRRVGPPGRR